jgi:hypothetical protein
MDATDTAAPEIRYCGRSQALLYNTIRPHASIGYKPPAPEVFVPAFAAWPAALRRPASPATLAQRPWTTQRGLITRGDEKFVPTHDPRRLVVKLMENCFLPNPAWAALDLAKFSCRIFGPSATAAF